MIALPFHQYFSVKVQSTSVKFLWLNVSTTLDLNIINFAFVYFILSLFYVAEMFLFISNLCNMACTLSSKILCIVISYIMLSALSLFFWLWCWKLRFGIGLKVCGLTKSGLDVVSLLLALVGQGFIYICSAEHINMN